MRLLDLRDEFDIGVLYDADRTETFMRMGH